MAWEGPQIKIPGLKAAADLSAAANQYKFVKLDANGDVILPTAATDKPVGVLQNRPKSGETAEIVSVGITKLQADGAINEGDLVGTSADGQADVKVPGTDTTEFVAGQALTAAAAAAEVFTALINCANLGRAA